MVDIYEEIVKIRQRGERAALATIIERKGSVPRKDHAKMLIRQDGSALGTIGGGCAEAEVWRTALEVMRDEKPRLLHFEMMEDEPTDAGLLCGGKIDVYVEPIIPDPTVYIFGAGHVSKALVPVIKPAGFRVVVIDDRANFANKQRFPDADEIIVEDFNKAVERLNINEFSYIVIATRGHHYDLDIMRWAVQTPARYIGMLGSRRKLKIFINTLIEEGVSEELLKRLYSPIGVEIGSETPEEIAISIAAEMVAVRKNINVRELKKKAAVLVGKQVEADDAQSQD